MIFAIIIAILIFSCVVLIHELGHFSAARKFGIKVYEFGLGIPPKAKKIFTDKKGTDYTLNWIPLGGFVKLAGENLTYFDLYDEKGNKLTDEQIEEKVINNEDIFDKKGDKIPISDTKEIRKIIEENKSNESLINKPFYAQACVILAGVFMNFILAIVIFSILFMVGITPIGLNTKIDTNLDIKTIPTLEQAKKDGFIINKGGIYLSPLEDGIAIKSGIKEGDIVTQIGEEKVDSLNDFVNILRNNPNVELDFYINRLEENQENFKQEIIKITPNSDGKIQSYIGENVDFNPDFKYQYPPLEAIGMGAKETFNQSLLTIEALGTLVRKIATPKTPEEREEAINSVSGPVGVVNLLSKTMSEGFVFMIILLAIISINLGVFNLLPIPALDGGKFFFMVINGIGEKIFKTKIIKVKFEMVMHVIFFFLLIILGILIAYKDVMQIIGN